MRTFILFTLALLAGTASASSVCSDLLGGDRFDRIEAAVLADETTLSKLERSRDELMAKIPTMRTFANGRVLAEGPRDRQFDLIGQFIYLAVSARARGWFATAAECAHVVAAEVQALTNHLVDQQLLNDEIGELAADRTVGDAAGLLSFMIRNKPNVERAFLSDLREEPTGRLSFGPREMELTKLIMQYGHADPEHRLLDIGGQGTVAAVLRRYLPKVSMTLLHAARAPDPVRSWADRHDHTIARGAFMKADVRKDLLKRGKFQVVTALDVIHRDEYPRENADLMTRALRALLRDHGLLIILNDRGRPPPFTIAQARAAGLSIVAWDVDRSLNTALRELVYPGEDPGLRGGDLRAFVLRVGLEDLARIPNPGGLLTKIRPGGRH